MSVKKRVLIAISVLSVLSAAAAAVTITAVPELRWRTTVLAMKAQGRVPELGWFELIHMLIPGSGFYLETLTDGGTVHSAISNPNFTPTDVEAGMGLFVQNCSVCHKDHEVDQTGVDLSSTNYKVGDSDWAVYRAIARGIPATAMPAFDLPARDVWRIVSYLRSKQQSAIGGPLNATVQNAAVTAVTPQSLRDASSAPENWLMYSGSFNGHRRSALTEIDSSNAHQLELKWIHQFTSPNRFVEATPIVVDSVMYVVEPPNNVLALNANTGESIWTYRRGLPAQISLCCGEVNRGVAVWQDKVLLATLDAHLVAIEASTGRVVWETEIADAALGYSSTSAPLVVDDKVIVGVGGGEFGIRGLLDAYDALTGRRLWRFYTVPGPGEPGNETWPGESWRTGGGATWMTGSFDPELNLIYWGVGNPWPDFNGRDREGDNLYTDSVVALDADTGELRWHFQFVPHDRWDYDANSVPVLVDLDLNGAPRKLLMIAIKNGFYYLLDRRNGEFILAEPVVRHSWAQRIDPTGRPIIEPNSIPSTEGVTVYPGAGGGAGWFPPSYNNSTNLFYIPLLEHGQVFVRGPSEDWDPTKLRIGGTSVHLSNEPARAMLRAVIPTSGELAWEFGGRPRTNWTKAGGTLTTAGNLVFWSDVQDFLALDATSGTLLWQFDTGGGINSGPMSYQSENGQRVAIAAGRAILAFGLRSP